MIDYWLQVTAVLSLTIFIIKTINLNSKYPGPFSIPFIGSLDLIAKFPSQKTHEVTDKHLEKYGKFLKINYTSKDIFIVIDALEARRILAFRKRATTLSDVSPGIMDHVLFAMETNSEWYSHRKLLLPGFSPVHLRYAAKAALECCNALVNQINSVQAYDVLRLMSAYALDVIGLFAFGEDVGAIRNPEKNSVWTGLSDITLVPANFRIAIPRMFWGLFGLGVNSDWVVRNRNRVYAYLQAVVERGKIVHEAKGPVEGLDRSMNIMQRMLQTEYEGKLSKNEVFGEVLGFFVAGHETTMNTATFIILELCRNPEIQEKLYQQVKSIKLEMDDSIQEKLALAPLVELVVKETQRLHSIVPYTDRISEKEETIMGYTIPANSNIAIFMRGIHRSEEYWIEPLRFNPERWITDKINPSAFMPFGDGPRNCIGQKMAMTELKVLIFTLIQNFRIEMTANTKLEFNTSITHSVTGLECNFYKR